jgi:bla regulator protein BlaR1
MDFEKQLRDELQQMAEKIQPSDKLKTRVATSFERYRQEKIKRNSPMKKRLIAGIIAVAILVPTGVFAGPKIPSLVEKIVGSPEEASQKVGMSKEMYSNFNKTLEVAKQILTKEEFERYAALEKESFQFLEKISVIEDGERNTDTEKYNSLTPDEKKRFEENMSELNVFDEKIYGKYTYTLEKAQKLVSYPIKLPAYIPAGYTLEKTTIKAQPTVGKPKPVVQLDYIKDSIVDNMNYEERFTIVQTDISGTSDFVLPGPFNNKKYKFEKLTDYTLDGYSISFGQ